MNWKVIYPEEIRNFLLYLYWRKSVGKSSNSFDQLLIYWKVQINRNNLQVYNARFLIFLLELPSITLFMSNSYSNAVSPVLHLYSFILGVLEKEKSDIAHFPPGIINYKQINIRTIKKDESVLQEAGHISNTSVLIFPDTQCLHLTYLEVAWVLVFLGTQVQLQIILTWDYLPHFLSDFY